MTRADPGRLNTSPYERRARPPLRDRQGPNRTAASLPLVLGEIVGLMRARGALLTLHGEDGEAPVVVHADAQLEGRTLAAAVEMLTHRTRRDFQDGRCFWRDDTGSRRALLLMPVEQLAGHGRLVITILFDHADARLRSEAERLFVERRPFATGFFQLWQENRLLEQRARSFETVLDQSAIGVVMLDRQARIAYANHAADELLAAGDGIGRMNGALRATSLADGVNLQAAISHASGGAGLGAEPSGGVPLLAFRRKKGPPLVAAFLPATAVPSQQGDVAAVVYLVDPEIDTARMLSPLCQLYGLSRVETALVCHLAAGETLTSTAQKIRVKEQTARGYLKTIFIKTGTRRQTELIALMLSSLVRMKRDVRQEALALVGADRASPSPA